MSDEAPPSTQSALVRLMREAIERGAVASKSSAEVEYGLMRDDALICRSMSIKLVHAISQGNIGDAIAVATSLSSWARNIAIRMEIARAREAAVADFALSIPKTVPRVGGRTGPAPDRQIRGRY